MSIQIEDLIVDTHIISRNQTGSTLLVAAIKKETLRELTGMLKEINIDPKLISVDLFGLFNYAKYYLSEKRDIAIIDIGASKTSMCLISNGNIKGARTIMIGGNLITEAISNRYSLSFDEAEKMKLGGVNGGEIEEGSGMDLSMVIQPPLQNLLTEIEKTLHAMESGEPDKISHVYLSGGGARLKGIKESVSRQLGIGSVDLLKPSSQAQTGKIKGFGRNKGQAGLDEVFVPAIGMLLGKILGEKGCNINFKKGEFVSAKEKKELKGRFIYVGSAVVLMLIIGISNIYIKYQIKERRYQEVKSRIRSVFKEALPNVKNIVDEASQLKAASEDLKKKAGIIIGSDITALGILDLLSEDISKETAIDVYDLVIDQDKVRMDAETDSFESVDKIKTALKKTPIFKDVNISDAKLGADQKKVKFRINITMSEKI